MPRRNREVIPLLPATARLRDMLQWSELASSYPFRAVVHMQERQAASSDCANGEHDVTLLGRHDEFADVSRWDDETAVRWVRQLDARAAGEDQCVLREKVIRALEISEGETVVDVGCGTGALLIDAARIVGRTGRVVGVEPQSHLAARARERVADEGVARYVEVVDGRGESLPVASESADVALASTVLIHLPLAAATATLREMVRVVTRNGRVAAIEQDTDTWTIDHPDRELTRRIIAFNSDQRSADGWRGRHLRRMFLEADLDTDVSTFVHVDPVEGSYLYSLGQRIATAAVAAGAVEQESADRWLALLRASARESRFFSTMNYVICVGHKERARSRVSRNSELSCPCRR